MRVNNFLKSSFIVLLVNLFLVRVLCSQGLSVKFDNKGLSELSFQSQELINVGKNIGSALSLEGYKIIKKGGLKKDIWPAVKSQNINVEKKEYLTELDFGKVVCQYSQINDTLFITTTITNTLLQDTLAGINIFPLQLRFPGLPEGFVKHVPYYHYNMDGPSVIKADYKAGQIVLCNEDVKSNVFLGLLDANINNVTEYKIWMSNIPFYGINPVVPDISMRLAPGKSVTQKISLRFCKTGSDAYKLAETIYSRYRVQYPFRLKWADRRPIGYVVLSSVENNKNHKNPRGWFHTENINIADNKGREQFKKYLFEFADRTIENLRKMNAQGVITWDIEGQQFPHPLSYVGSPDKLKFMAPEMDLIADEYFKKYIDAGFKTGICIRPDTVLFDGSKMQMNRAETKDAVETLAKKIRYANKRWGCSLFYIDSNGDPSYPMNVSVFKNLQRVFPDFLLIPEHENISYFAYTAPYGEWRQGQTNMPALAKNAYSEGAMVINIADGLSSAEGNLVEKEIIVQRSIEEGNILLFRAWFDDPSNRIMKAVFDRINRKTD